MIEANPEQTHQMGRDIKPGEQKVQVRQFVPDRFGKAGTCKHLDARDPAPVYADPEKRKGVSVIPAQVGAQNMRRVCSYCRVSTIMPEQRTSFESQENHYEDLIRSTPGWMYAGTYLEAGVSGTKAEKRPELQRLLQDCRDRKIDLVLTKSISRFARSAADCLEIVRELSKLGVSIWFEREGIHTDTMGSEFLLSVLSGIAEEESRSLSGNVKWGIRKRFLDGTYIQPKVPYGYRRNDEGFTVIPEEAAVVQRIFGMALEGKGTVQIARSLESDHIESPEGGRWSPGTVRSILSNVFYTGDVLYQKSYKDHAFRQRKNKGELDQYYDKGHHDPIVSRSDYEKALKATAMHAKLVGYQEAEDRYRSSNRYCFSGILFCGVCGSVMYRQNGDGSRPVWICSLHREDPGKCGMKPQGEDDVKRAFINCLNKLSWSRQHPNNDVTGCFEDTIMEGERGSHEARIKEINDLLEENRIESGRLAALDAVPGASPDIWVKRTAAVEQGIRLMQEKKRILKGGSMYEPLCQFKRALSSWKITDDAGAFPDGLFRRFVEKCTINSGKEAVISFKCGLSLPESLLAPRLGLKI